MVAVHNIQNNTGDNLTGSSTVLKLEWTEVRSGDSAHQVISKDNKTRQLGHSFRSWGTFCVRALSLAV